MDRRRLFKLAGVGSVVAAGAALPVVGRIATQLGESPQIELVVDRERGVVQAPFVGRPVALTLA